MCFLPLLVSCHQYAGIFSLGIFSLLGISFDFWEFLPVALT